MAQVRGPRKNIGVEGFRRAVRIEMDKLIPFAQKVVVSEVYKAVIQQWPNDTFWSLSNHRISITDSPIFRLEPATRPKEKGALSSKAQSVALSELAKLDRITTKVRKILIGNSVPYARDVGGKAGFGAIIYAEAARNGAARATRILKDEKVIGKLGGI